MPRNMAPSGWLDRIRSLCRRETAQTMAEYAGFSPRPQPVLIATFKTKGEALGISKPLDRDRAVDESGNQLSVFGRRGARPFNFQEMMRLLRTQDGAGQFFKVSDAPRTVAATAKP